MLRYTIGSDPELFIVNVKTKKVVSAIDKIPGSKESPFTQGLPKGFGLQTDNVLAEFNIPPATNVDEFIHNIEFMKEFIRKTVKDIDEDLDIMCKASSKVPLKELKHPQAKEAGCDPDYCVYTGNQNEPGKLGRSTLRSGGCHFHVGYPSHNIDTSLAMLRYIDAFVGIPSIIYDTDSERRKLYGKAGCFRLQPWGFEYRTLSSFWIANQSRMRFIWNQLIYALYNYERDSIIPDGQLVQNIINNNDVETAKLVIDKFNLICPNNVQPE